MDRQINGIAKPAGGTSLQARVTQIACPALCPELKLHLVPEGQTFEGFHASHTNRFGAGPPYWARAWPGGEALARYVLDNPQIVAGRRIVDLGAGSGLVGIAAALSGAGCVTAVDRDPHALAAIRLNAGLNGVSLETSGCDFTRISGDGFDVALAADLWYERFDARSANVCLTRLRGAGVAVFLGDPVRAHFPRRRTKQLAAYDLPDASGEGVHPGTITASVHRFIG